VPWLGPVSWLSGSVVKVGLEHARVVIDYTEWEGRCQSGMVVARIYSVVVLRNRHPGSRPRLSIGVRCFKCIAKYLPNEYKREICHAEGPWKALGGGVPQSLRMIGVGVGGR